MKLKSGIYLQTMNMILLD